MPRAEPLTRARYRRRGHELERVSTVRDAACRRVSERMVERIESLFAGLGDEVERLAGPGVGDSDRETAVGSIPKEPDLDSVVRAVRQLLRLVAVEPRMCALM